MILTDEELVTLTGRIRPSAQRRALDSMNVIYRIRPDNSLVVLWSDLQSQPKPQRKVIEPNFAAAR